MKISQENLGRVLSRLGLTFGTDTLRYADGDFTKYVSSEYLGSPRKQTDEVYRMYELILLHRLSGLRIVYTTTESYFGDSVDYKVIGLFIITRENQRLEVLDVDFDRKVFVTEGTVVPFTATEKRAEV